MTARVRSSSRHRLMLLARCGKTSTLSMEKYKPLLHIGACLALANLTPSYVLYILHESGLRISRVGYVLYIYFIHILKICLLYSRPLDLPPDTCLIYQYLHVCTYLGTRYMQWFQRNTPGVVRRRLPVGDRAPSC